MMNQFSIKEALSFGWKTTLAHKGFFIGTFLLFFLFQFLPTLISSQIKGAVDFTSGEFVGSETPEALIQALIKQEISVPSGSVIESLNQLLERKELYQSMRIQPSESRETIRKLKKGEAVSLIEVKTLNRSLLKANFSDETPDSLKWNQNLLLLLINVVSFIVNAIITIGLIRISLNLTDNKKAEISELFKNGRFFLRYFGISLVSWLVFALYMGICLLISYLIVRLFNSTQNFGMIFSVIMFALVLYIFPVLFISIRWSFSAYLLLDQDIGVFESLKRSFELTKGHVLKLISLGAVLCLVNIAGALCLLVGLLITIPTSWIAFTFVYRKFVPNIEAESQGLSA